MDKAPAYGAGDCRFESCLSQTFYLLQGRFHDYQSLIIRLKQFCSQKY